MKQWLITTVLFAASGPARAGIPVFTEHLMGNTGSGSQGQTTLVDADLDGDLDWLMGASEGTYFWEFKGMANGKPDWAMHKIGGAGGCETSAKAFDVTGDGYPDHLSGTKWFKNPGNSGSVTGKWQVSAPMV